MSGSIIPPLNDDGTARRLPNDPNGYTPEEARLLAEDGAYVRRTGWLSGADPVPFKHAQSPEAREWMRETGGTLPPFPLTDAAEKEDVLAAQLAAALEDAEYQASRARYWADLANERQGIINQQSGRIHALENERLHRNKGA